MAVGYGARTYKPGLLIACKVIRKFINRWRTQLENSLTPEGFNNVLQVLDAVEAVISMLSDPASPDAIE